MHSFASTSATVICLAVSTSHIVCSDVDNLLVCEFVFRKIIDCFSTDAFLNRRVIIYTRIVALS